MPFTPIIKERIYDEKSKIGKTKTTIQKYNSETGEVKTITTEKVIAHGRNPFIQLNKKVLPKLLALLTPIEFMSLLTMINGMGKETNIVLVTQEELAEQMNINIRTVARAFSTLSHYDFIRNKSHGQWMVNPDIAIECGYENLESLKETYYNLQKPKEKRKIVDERGSS